jgi:hypothetical protein
VPADSAENRPEAEAGWTFKGWLGSAAVVAAAVLVSLAIFLLLVWGRTVR